jgi:hypothetical protein
MSLGKWILTFLLSVAVTTATLAAFLRVTTIDVGRANPAVAAAPTAASVVDAVEMATATATPLERSTELAAENVAPDAAADMPPPADAPTAASTEAVAPAAAPAAAAAAETKVVISMVHKPGQRTLEYVLLVNESAQVDMTGWTIESPRGAVYTFPNFLLFPETFVRVYSMNGADSPTSLFWNQNEAIWKSGDVVLLKNGGVEMARFTVQ